MRFWLPQLVLLWSVAAIAAAPARAEFVGPLWLATAAATYPHSETPKPKLPPVAKPVVFRSDAFVRMFERLAGVTAGGTRTIQDCMCTLRYIGAEIDGRHYKIHIDKLD